MRRSILAVALPLMAALAAPAAANPIAFVSGPSPVAIVSGILTVTGPEVNADDFGLDATGGSMFTGNWSGFTQRTANGQPAGTWPGFGAAGASAPGRGGSNTQPSFPFVGQLPGYQPTTMLPPGLLVAVVIFTGLPAGQIPVIDGLFLPPGVVQGNDLNGANVPEPGTIVLLSSGLAGLAVARRRRKAARGVSTAQG